MRNPGKLCYKIDRINHSLEHIKEMRCKLQLMLLALFYLYAHIEIQSLLSARKLETEK